MVSNAWAGFGAAFGPLVVLGLYWKRMTFGGALAGIVVGASTVLIWIYAPFTIGGESPGKVIYEIVPGFVLSTIAIILVSLAGKQPSHSMQELFDVMVRRVREDS